MKYGKMDVGATLVFSGISGSNNGAWAALSTLGFCLFVLGAIDLIKTYIARGAK